MLSIQENLLQGSTAIERFRLAQALGFGAIEVWAERLNDDAVLELAQAMDATQLPISAIYMGALDGYLATDVAIRDQAIDRFRQALTDAHDLRIPYVLVTPQINRENEVTTLTPEQEKAMLIWFVRVVNDLAGAMDTQMCLLPLEPSQSRALNTLTQAYDYLAEMNFHPAVRLAGDFYSFMRTDFLDADLKQPMPLLSYVHIHSPKDRTAHSADDDFKKLLTTLRAHDFTGMVSLACGLPNTQPQAPLENAILRQFVEDLHKMGFD